MSWWTRSGVRASAARVTSGAGSTSRKLPPLDHSTSRSPRAGRVDHLGRGEPGRRRARRSPTPRASARRVRLGDRDAAGERGRVATHLGAALHARVAADRHQARAGPADVAAREPEVHDRVHVVDAVLVLGDAHRPHEHRALAPPRTSARSAPCRRGVAPDCRSRSSNDSSSSSSSSASNPTRVRGHELAVDAARSRAGASARR